MKTPEPNKAGIQKLHYKSCSVKVIQRKWSDTVSITVYSCISHVCACMGKVCPACVCAYMGNTNVTRPGKTEYMDIN